MTGDDGAVLSVLLSEESFWQGKCQSCAHDNEDHGPWCGVITGSDGAPMPEPVYCECITHESVERHVAAAIARDREFHLDTARRLLGSP
jgi:hypothetical protein